jgi:hypothetical protein
MLAYANAESEYCVEMDCSEKEIVCGISPNLFLPDLSHHSNL